MVSISGWVIPYIPQLKFIEENHKFELEFQHHLINESIYYIEEFAKGDNNALFVLKNVIFELDLELNPDLYKQDRANYLSLSDVERIKRNKDPFGENYN